MSDERCWWCGAPAVRLCDTVLRGEREQLDIRGKMSMCSAPLCEECGESSWMSLDHCNETLDKCPWCLLLATVGAAGRVPAATHREKCREHARSNFKPRLRLVVPA